MRVRAAVLAAFVAAFVAAIVAAVLAVNARVLVVAGEGAARTGLYVRITLYWITRREAAWQVGDVS